MEPPARTTPAHAQLLASLQNVFLRPLGASAEFEAWLRELTLQHLEAALKIGDLPRGAAERCYAELGEFFRGFAEAAAPSEGLYFVAESANGPGPDDFVRKDFEGDARRALDAFVKERLLHEAALEQPQAQTLEHLARLRQMGRGAIAALAIRERLRLALFLAPRLVMDAHTCVTLARIPDSLHASILTNEAQWRRWHELFGLAAETPAERRRVLASSPTLPVDTGLFEPGFELALGAIAADIDGLLIHADNFQALRLLVPRFASSIRLVYLDPPYNKGKDGFVYKDAYQPRSWQVMIENRLRALTPLLAPGAPVFQSIDDCEVHRLRLLSESAFGPENFVANVVWQKKYTRANDARWFSDNHEHLLVFAWPKSQCRFNLEPRGARQLAAYQNPDGHRKGPWKATPLHAKSGRPGEFRYTFRNGVSWSPPPGTYSRFSVETLARLDAGDEVWFGPDGRAVPSRKTFLGEAKAGLTPTTLWLHEEVGHNHEANSELKRMFPHNPFNNPKPLRLLGRMLQLATDRSGGWVLDYFAGSGSTGHAVIEANRADGGQRRFILVEQAAYFDTLVKPRVLKALYARDWKGGRPVGGPGLSQTLQVLRLETFQQAIARLQPPTLSAEGEVAYTLAPDGGLQLVWPERLSTAAVRSLLMTMAYALGLQASYWRRETGLLALEGQDHEGARVLLAWEEAGMLNSARVAEALAAQGLSRVYLNARLAAQWPPDARIAPRVLPLEPAFEALTRAFGS